MMAVLKDWDPANLAEGDDVIEPMFITGGR